MSFGAMLEVLFHRPMYAHCGEKISVILKFSCIYR